MHHQRASALLVISILAAPIAVAREPARAPRPAGEPNATPSPVPASQPSDNDAMVFQSWPPRIAITSARTTPGTLTALPNNAGSNGFSPEPAGRPQGFAQSPETVAVRADAAEKQAAAADRAIRARIAELRGAFFSSSATRLAHQAERQAAAAYVEARKSALAAATPTPSYRAALEERARLDAVLATLDAKPANGEGSATMPAADAPTVLDRFSLALKKLTCNTTISQYEWIATQHDPNVETARQRLIDAGIALSAENSRFERSLLDDPELRDLRQKLSYSRVELAAARAYLQTLDSVEQSGSTSDNSPRRNHAYE